MTENNGASIEPGADPIADAEAARAQLEQAQREAQSGGSPDAGDTPEPVQPDPGPDAGDGQSEADPESFDLTGEQEAAEVDWSEQVEEQIFKNGKFSDHFKGKLAKERGLSKGEIADMEAGALMRRTENVRDFMQNAGGSDFAQVQAWAKANIPAEEREAYSQAAQSKDKFARQMAARDLYRRYQEAGGGESQQLDGRPARPAPSGPQINGTQDFLSVLNDPRGMSAGSTRSQYEQEKMQAAAAFADHLGINVTARPRK